MMWWWPLSTPNLPFSVEAPEQVSVTGESWLPTKWQAPVVRRFFYPLGIITVDSRQVYRVYFVSGKTAMCGWWPIYARSVAVRVGPGTTHFFFWQPRHRYLLNATLVGGLLSSGELRSKYPNAMRI